MVRVNDLRPSPWAPSLWVVKLEGWRRRLLLEEEVIRRCDIGVGTEIDADLLYDLQALSRTARLKEAALRLLAWRPRSRAELRQRLLHKGNQPAAVDRLLDELQQLGLLDDTHFASYWVEHRMQFRPKSRKELQAELRAKGVESSEIRDIIDAFPEENACLAIAVKRGRTLRNLSEQDFTRKLLQYLLRRGFPFDLASRAVKEAWDTLQRETDNRDRI